MELQLKLSDSVYVIMINVINVNLLTFNNLLPLSMRFIFTVQPNICISYIKFSYDCVSY